MYDSSLTAEELRQVLSYCPDCGKFRWLEPASRRVKPGDAAGFTKANGYVKIRVNGVQYFAHRLAWLYVYGKWPQSEIDHINHDRSDNRIANLRDVVHMTNANNRRPRPRDQRAVPGVPRGNVRPAKCGTRWEAYYYRGSKYVHVGTFPTPESASEALRAAVGEA